MEKIDLKDRKILYELDLNCRQSNTQIGKKVGLKKDVVAYRIKRMQEEGIIKCFWTSINTFRLGYHVYRIYIDFQYVVSPDVKNEIIQHFCNYKNSWAVLTVQGPIDLDVVVWVKDVYDFYQFWDKTLEKYEDYFEKYTVSIYIEAVSYKKSYLLSDEYEKKDRELYRTTCVGKPVEIDEVDYQLLNDIAVNARAPLIELADKLDCSSQTVKYRMKNLMKLGIIQAFRVNIDYSKLGLQNFAVDIYLKKYQQRKPIINYVSSIPYLFNMNVAVGWSDLSFEFAVESLEKLIKIMEDIESNFPGAIRKQEYWINKKVHRERWLPEL